MNSISQNTRVQQLETVLGPIHLSSSLPDHFLLASGPSIGAWAARRDARAQRVTIGTAEE
ncbi:hypothetical protein [Pseudomonas sp.]|uniref:hypothetical protein n=1 Tax=Pseudomonas sp. TaxID=306 RepID=UPI003D12947F